MKSIPSVIVELDRIYNSYADQLSVSSSIASFLLDSADMRATGNQLEVSLRTLMSDLLPSKVNVSQGHIIDSNMAISYQQDIIIAEGLSTKSLIKTLDGTEFLTFESVYSVGEVKKSLSLDTISSTSKSLKDLKDRLKRAPVSPFVFSTIPEPITTATQLTNYPLRNPLFSFLFAMDFGTSFKPKDLKSIFDDRDNWTYLPNCFVILNKGLFIVLDSTTSSDSISIKLYPEFVKDNLNCKWFFLPFSENKGRNIAYLLYFLQQHIQDTLLTSPRIMDYASDIIEINPADLVPLQ